MTIHPKSLTDIAAMRESGQMLATILQELKRQTTAQMSTKALADIATEELKRLGGEPAQLGYQGFPDVLCVSINDEVVHGIPRTDRIIQEGDIVSLDFAIKYRGMITDSALSLIVGKPLSAAHQRLLIETERSLYAGIDVVHNGARTGDIGAAVQAVLDKGNYGIVRDLVGHGVGYHLHEDPNIPNYGYRGSGELLHQNMTVAIEPMATLGDYKVSMDDDGWTIRTLDGSWAAHFEHTILITNDGADILTQL